MNACDKGAQWAAAVRVGEDARQRELRPNVISVGSLISVWGKCSEWRRAVGALGVGRVDLACWNGAITGCEKAGLHEMSTRLLEDMVSLDLRPDTISFNAVCSSFARDGLWKASVNLLERTLKLGRPSIISFNSCISCCGPQAAWPQALALFQAASKQLRCSLVSLAALAAVLPWRRALAGASKEVFGSSAAMSQSAKATQWRQVVQLWSRLGAEGLCRDVVALGALTESWPSKGAWEEAMKMLCLGDSNEIIWGAVVAACYKAEAGRKRADFAWLLMVFR